MSRTIRVLIVLFIIVTGTCFSLAHPIRGFAEKITTAKVDIFTGVYNSEEAESFWAKITALEETGQQARAAGQAVGFSETFSEDEINAAFEEYVADHNDQLVKLKDIKVFLHNESVLGVASCTILGRELSIYAIPDIWVENNKPRFKINTLDMQGAPRFINGLITKIINQRIDAEYNRLIREYDYFEIDRIIIESGQVTVIGVVG
jgi:hypothetical protein